MGKTRVAHSQNYKKEYGKQFPVAASALGLQHAFCIVCSADFSINHGGMNDIQKHMNSKKHKAFSEIKDKARPISTFFSSSGDLDVIRAETLFTEFIIEHNLPFSVADHGTKLFRKMFPDSNVAKKYSCGRTKTSYLVEALGKQSKQSILDVIRVSPFSMATDGSTDYEDVKLYPICVRYCDPNSGKVNSVILSLKECNKPSTGENIFKLLEAEMDELEIPWENLICFSADNASVMLGKMKGVAAFLLRQAPSLHIAGCPCHLIHLAAGRAAKQLPVFVDDLLVDIFYYLEKSSKRKQEFKEFQKKAGVPHHKIVKHVATRWLSLGHCIERLLEQWNALLLFFNEEDKKNNPCTRKRSASDPLVTSPPKKQMTLHATNTPKSSKTVRITSRSSLTGTVVRKVASSSKTKTLTGTVASKVASSSKTKTLTGTVASKVASSSKTLTGTVVRKVASSSKTLTGTVASKVASSSKTLTGTVASKVASSSKTLTGTVASKVASSSKTLNAGSATGPDKTPHSAQKSSAAKSQPSSSYASTKSRNVCTMMKDPNYKLYCLFLTKAIPIFEVANIFLQKDEPCIHRLHSVMCHQLQELLVRFVKPDVVAKLLQSKVYEVDFHSEMNQKCDDELFIGQPARQFIKENTESCNVKEFYASARKYYVAACEYMKKSYPFKDDVLVNAEIIDVAKRTNIKLSQWMFYVKKYPQCLSPQEKEQVEDEFCHFQADRFSEEILQPDVRIDQVWHSISKLTSPATGKPKYTSLYKIARVLLVMYHSNADCERIFSLVNKNKTEFRACLSTRMLGNLMTRRMELLASDTPCYMMNHSSQLLKKAKSCTSVGLVGSSSQ